MSATCSHPRRAASRQSGWLTARSCGPPRRNRYSARLDAGSIDGGLRAYNTANGDVIWTFDTNKDFETVNGVKATGASLEGAGPVVAGGMLFINSGYGGLAGRPGNVLLAFGLD